MIITRIDHLPPLANPQDDTLVADDKCVQRVKCVQCVQCDQRVQCVQHVQCVQYVQCVQCIQCVQCLQCVQIYSMCSICLMCSMCSRYDLHDHHRQMQTCKTILWLLMMTPFERSCCNSSPWRMVTMLMILMKMCRIIGGDYDYGHHGADGGDDDDDDFGRLWKIVLLLSGRNWICQFAPKMSPSNFRPQLFHLLFCLLHFFSSSFYKRPSSSSSAGFLPFTKKTVFSLQYLSRVKIRRNLYSEVLGNWFRCHIPSSHSHNISFHPY